MELDSSGKFPNYCWFCKDSKAKRIRSKGRNIHEPVCVVKSDIKETLIQAARKRNDDTLLCLIEGDDVDLHQKGLKKHSSCYTDYTRVVYERDSKLEEKTNTTMEKVREVVEQNVRRRTPTPGKS